LAGGDVDADGSLRLAQFGQESYRALHRRVAAQVVEGGRLGNRLSVLAHSGHMEGQSLRHLPRASSKLEPAVMQPGKSGKLTP
jgi:hypothetical protein